MFTEDTLWNLYDALYRSLLITRILFISFIETSCKNNSENRQLVTSKGAIALPGWDDFKIKAIILNNEVKRIILKIKKLYIPEEFPEFLQNLLNYFDLFEEGKTLWLNFPTNVNENIRYEMVNVLDKLVKGKTNVN